MANGNITVKMKLSPTQAGKLYMQNCALEEENKKLKYELGQTKISLDHKTTLLASCEKALDERDTKSYELNA